MGFPLDDLHKRIASLHRIFHTAQYISVAVLYVGGFSIQKIADMAVTHIPASRKYNTWQSMNHSDNEFM